MARTDKDKYINISHKEMNQWLNCAFFMGMENAEVLLLNAFLDYLKIERHIGMNEDEVFKVAEYFNRYSQYMENDTIKSEVFMNNFEHLTGLKLEYLSAKRATVKTVMKALHNGYYDHVSKKNHVPGQVKCE